MMMVTLNFYLQAKKNTNYAARNLSIDTSGYTKQSNINIDIQPLYILVYYINTGDAFHYAFYDYRKQCSCFLCKTSINNSTV